jgi:hypothetical protein
LKAIIFLDDGRLLGNALACHPLPTLLVRRSAVIRSTGTPGAATGSGLEPGMEFMPVIPGNECKNTAKRSISQRLKFFD